MIVQYMNDVIKKRRNRMWMGVPEALEYTKCRRTTVYNAVRSGYLKSSKPEGVNKIVFRREWLDKWLEGK